MKEVITFFGADSSVGTTMLAQSVAEKLSEEGKTLFIMASSSPIIDFLNVKGQPLRSLDELRPLLRAGSISVKDVMGICYRRGDLYILPPPLDTIRVRYFVESDLKTILDLAKIEFDHVVIDAGCDLQYPLGASALISANKVFIVMKQAEKSLRRFRLLSESFLNPLSVDYDVVINQYDETSVYYRLDKLKKILKNLRLFTICRIKRGEEAELRMETLMRFSLFREQIKIFLIDTEIIKFPSVYGRPPFLELARGAVNEKLRRIQP